MKVIFSKVLSVIIAVFLILTLFQPIAVNAQSTSAAPRVEDVTIANNSGTSDTVTVENLEKGDKVYVYTAKTGGKLLGSATVSSSKTEVTVKVSQLGTAAGKVYISIMSKGELESSRTEVSYDAEVQTEAPDADNIAVTNNAGKADLIYIAGLYGGETIKVYNAQTKGKLIGSTTVSATKTEATLKVSQLGIDAGSVYITLTNKGELESERVKADYSEEPKSYSLDPTKISVTNNAGINDSVVVTYLSLGDIIKVYDAPKGGNLLGSATVPSSKTEVSISIAQLSKNAGSVHISVTNLGCRESDRTPVAYPGENTSAAPSAWYITITNNGGIADTVKVSNLNGGDIIKVYDAATGGKLLGTGTVSSTGNEVTVSVPQLISDDGCIYISVINKGKFESNRTQIAYSPETKTSPVNTGKVTIANNVGKSDTVSISGLTGGDVVKVYDSTGKTVLGTATVAASKTEAAITVTQLGTASGYIYISVTGKGKLESDLISVPYPAEAVSDSTDAYNITVVNNPAGKADTVRVTNLNSGDVIKVYDMAVNGTLLGSATVPASKTEATVTITQLGTTSGYIYVSVTGSSKNESARTRVEYSAETVSDPADADNIIVTNNATGTPDTVEVTDITSGDVIKVYDAANGGNLLGSATVAANSTYATVSIVQLGTAAGNVYVSITGSNKLESSRIKVSYLAEKKTDGIDAGNISVTNNSGAADTVEVTGLNQNDVIKVYDAAKGGKLLGTATVSGYSSYATVSVTQLGVGAGSVYVSITSTNNLESDRIKVDYTAEASSTAPAPSNIIIANNTGAADTVQVTGLDTSDIIKVYDSANGGTLLGSASVTSGTTATVSINQLGVTAGSVYVSVTNKTKIESARTKVDYPGEANSTAPSSENIEIENNVGADDLITVYGLTDKDTVKVYDAAKGGNLLGSATAENYQTSVSITVSQLGISAGSLYVTITSSNKLESERIKADYPGEASSTAPSAANIAIDNNAGTSDIIKVMGLNTNDTVKVYSSAAGGTLLGSATVTSGTEATVNITQLGTAAGSVHITVTSKSKSESERIKADYPGEMPSSAPNKNNIEIENNVGSSDTIKVTGLSGGDVINVYDAEKAGNLLGSATVDTYAASATISVTQLGSSAGSVYVSVTSKAKLESERIKADYTAEAVTAAPAESSITVENNAGISDNVHVTGLLGGDIVNVYDSAKVGNLLGIATVSTYDSSVSISITQLGSTAGNIYVSVTSVNKTESTRIKVDYSAEPKTDAPSENDITIVNNAGIDDTIKVAGLTGGDTVKVYNAASGGTLLGTATASTYDSYATVTTAQIGSTAGYVYVTVTKKGYQESIRVKASYTAEPKSGTSDTSNILVFNNAGAPDKVKINGLSGGDVVNVYSAATGGSLLGTAAVESYDSAATVTITQLGTAAGKIYVSVKSKGKLEGDRVAVSYAAEQRSDPPADVNIKITNNAIIADTIQVTYLTAGDIVKVYDEESDGNVLGSGTVEDGEDEITISITQLGKSSGNVYVTVTSANKLESVRTQVIYGAEVTTEAPQAGNIIVSNNAAIADTLTVTFLKPNDVVRVYSKSESGTLLGSATVEEDKTEVTISIDKLDSSGGTVYVSVTSLGKAESIRTKITYAAEEKSAVLAASNITIKNNAGMADTITVSFLDPKDTVRVYGTASSGIVLGSATAANDSSEVTIKISQLGTTSGTVYLTVTSYGKLESDRIMVYYPGEATSDAPDTGDITITNNTGKSDTIKVINLTGNDIVNVYNASSGGSLLGTGTVPGDETSVTIKINQLGTSSGNVYITVTSQGAYESARIKAGYSAEN